jgi:hypothetical protein
MMNFVPLSFLALIYVSGINWINMAQDSGQWRALVNTVMNFLVLQKTGNFLSS